MLDRNYLGKVLKYVLTTLVSIGVALYVGYHLVNMLSSSVTTVLATYVDQDDRQSVDGYIMRSEELLYVNGEGNLNYLCDDGTKVSKSDPVVQLYTGAENSAEQSATLAEIDRRIELLSNSNLSAGQTYSDTVAVDDAIYETYYDVLLSAAGGDTQSAVQKRDNFLALLNRRQIVTGQIENYDAQIASLTEQRNQLVTSSGNAAQTLSAPDAGYYYSDIDGFESIFSADKVEQMTLQDFDEMTASSADTSLYSSSETGGMNAGKIVNGFEWYVACRIDLEELNAYNLDTYYYVVFPYNGDARIRMKLSRIIQESGRNDVVLVFSSMQMPENFNFLRRQTIEIVRASASGYRIPANAVRMEKDVQGVYILDGYIVRFRPIDPLLEVDNYLIVSTTYPDEDVTTLQEFDAVIVEGKNLYDGKVVS